MKGVNNVNFCSIFRGGASKIREGRFKNVKSTNWWYLTFDGITTSELKTIIRNNEFSVIMIYVKYVGTISNVVYNTHRTFSIDAKSILDISDSAVSTAFIELASQNPTYRITGVNYSPQSPNENPKNSISITAGAAQQNSEVQYYSYAIYGIK